MSNGDILLSIMINVKVQFQRISLKKKKMNILYLMIIKMRPEDVWILVTIN